jgi:two-component system response regulator TctD
VIGPEEVGLRGEPTKAQQRLLIIDDDDSFLTGIEHAIASDRWSVDIANDVERAAIMLDEKGYDLVLIDIALTGTSIADGLAMLARSMVQQPERAVVVVTAYASSQIIEHAIGLGARTVLQKPVGTEEILRVLSGVDRVATK